MSTTTSSDNCDVSPPHSQVLATPTLDAIHQELAEARANFPTPSLGRLSPNSYDLGELDLAPSTTIHTVESSDKGVAKGADGDSQGPG